MGKDASDRKGWHEDSPSTAPEEFEEFEVGTETLTMRYKTSLGWGIVALGIIGLVLGIGLLLLGQLVSVGILGILFLIVGYLYLKRPYFDVKPNRITIYNLLGNVVKRYPMTPNEQLVIKDNTLLIEQAGMARKVDVIRFLIKNEDWETLENSVMK